jgi:UrcA family protein
MKTLLIVAASITAFAAPALASAKTLSTQDDVGKVVVSFADLNLNNPAGQAELQARIHRAAVVACGIQPDNRDMPAAGLFNTCVQQSFGAATAAVPAASLVASNHAYPQGSAEPGKLAVTVVKIPAASSVTASRHND